MEEITPKTESKTVFWTLLFLMVSTVLLSVFLFSHQSLRLDESQSLWQTSHSPIKILTLIAGDVHVPFYHLLLHFWQTIFGNDVYTSRILSLVFFVISIPALYFLGTKSFGWKSALFASFLFAFSPFMNWYGNEIRMYSLLTFITIVNQYLFVRLFKGEGRGLWILYAITALFGLYTHYFFAFVLIAQGIFYLFNKQLFEEGAFKKFALIGGGLILSFAPWAWYVYEVGKINQTTPLLQSPSSVDFFNTLSQFVFGFQNDHLNTVLVSLWPLTVLFAFWALRKTRQNFKPETIYFMIALLLPLLLAFVVSVFFRPIFLSRYLIFTLPSLFLLVSWALQTYPRLLATSLRALIITTMVVTLSIEAFSATTPVKEDYYNASVYLSENANPSDIIVVSAPFTIYPLDYYYQGPVALKTLPIWDRNLPNPIPPFSNELMISDVEKLKGNHQNLYLILSYDQGYEDEVKSYFDNNFQLIDEQHFSPGLNLYKYKLRYD
jgi:mannosyltransferase